MIRRSSLRVNDVYNTTLESDVCLHYVGIVDLGGLAIKAHGD